MNKLWLIYKLFMAFSMFPMLHHLTYDPWIWGYSSHYSLSMLRCDNITGLNDLSSIFGFKNPQNCLHFTYWVISLASGSSATLMTFTISITSEASMTLTASFHQEITEIDVSIHPSTKMTQPGLSMWESCLLLLTKSKGYKSNGVILGTC